MTRLEKENEKSGKRLKKYKAFTTFLKTFDAFFVTTPLSVTLSVTNQNLIGIPIKTEVADVD